jgi:hypothetical protein
MNTDAIYAWEYMIETLRLCGKDARKDAAFTELVIDMMKAYPEELFALRRHRWAFAQCHGGIHR